MNTIKSVYSLPYIPNNDIKFTITTNDMKLVSIPLTDYCL